MFEIMIQHIYKFDANSQVATVNKCSKSGFKWRKLENLFIKYNKKFDKTDKVFNYNYKNLYTIFTQ